MGSVLVALIAACVLIFLVAWSVGAVYFGLKSRPGLRGLRRTLPRKVPLIVGACAASAVAKKTPPSFWRQLQYWQPELALRGVSVPIIRPPMRPGNIRG
jgi:hypothetical protein